MANLKEIGIVLLATGTVDLQNGDPKTTIYTVPPGKKAIVTHVVIKEPTASLAGGTDFNLGDGAGADTWKETINLAAMTGTNDYVVIDSNNAILGAVFDAGDAFGIISETGATLDAQAEMDVFGYEYDA